ncbi:MAG: GntR family transcriptional regulator [Candidimonas sp.]|nr:MAG: GntR family transcriptional regulator [Candidimonas sp.]
MHELSVGATLYKSVKRQILAGLASGEWKPGEVIPAEKRLSQQFGVSIGTLRKAIDELVAENILIRHQGRGTFVAMQSRDHHLFHFFSVVRQDGERASPSVSLVQFSKGKADKEGCERLGISSTAKVFRLTNTLSLQGAAVQIDEITLPEALFAGLTEAQLRNRPSTLYSLYQVDFGLNVIRISERIRAALASAAQARLLNVKPHSALLETHRTAFSYNNQPIEYRVSYLNTAHHEFAPREV